MSDGNVTRRTFLGDADGRHPWPGLEVRHLAALEAVSREGSFRSAADALGYVQSAVSQQIAMLERIVGARLVERSRGQRGITLTAAGQLLVDHGAQVIDHLHAARADLAALDGETTRQLGIEPTLSARLMPALAAAPLDLHEVDDADDLAQRLRVGALDLAVGEPPPTAPLTSLRLFDDPYVLVTAAASPLAHRGRPPELSELVALPLVGVLDARQAAHLRAWARECGHELSLAPRTRSADVGWTFAADERGAALGPRSALATDRPELATIGLDGVLPVRTVALAWHRDRLIDDEVAAVRALIASALRTAGLAPPLARAA